MEHLNSARRRAVSRPARPSRSSPPRGSTALLDYRAPEGGVARRATSSRCRSGRAGCSAWSGGAATGERRAGQAPRHRRACSTRRRCAPTMRAFLARAADYTLTPLTSDAAPRHPRARASASRPAARPLLRLTGDRARPDDRGARPRARRLRRLRQRSASRRASSPALAGRRRRRSSRASRPRACSPARSAPATRPIPRSTRDAAPRALSADQAAAAGDAARRGRGRRLFDHAAQGRHRLGQDRGLSRGGRRGARAAAARRWCCCPRSRCPSSSSTGSRRASAPARPNGIPASRRPRRRRAWRAVGERRRAAGGRRALGAVPAVPRPRPHRRRRGARRLLQAGGRRALPRPRHGGAARLDRGRGGGARLGHAVARELGQRRRRASTRGSTCPSASASAMLPEMRAIDLRARSRRAGPLDLRAAGAGGHRAARRRRAVAAVPQPPRLCAADALPGLRPAGRLRRLRRAHGRAPLPQAAGLPPVRRDQADPDGLPVLQGRGPDDRARPRRRAARRGGGGAVARRAASRSCPPTSPTARAR